MGKKIRSMAVLVVIAGVVITMMGQPWAHGATTGYVNISASTMSGREYSVHNKTGSSDCVAFVPLTNGGENTGDLDNGQGSYLANVVLPQGATVTSFKLFVNDADSDTDVFAHLITKKIVNNISPATGGYTEMAEANSTGSVIATMRVFTDNSITSAVVDNTKFMYFVEIVDCGIPEPYAVRVTYTTV